MKGVNISLDIDEFKDKRLEKNAKSVTSTPTKVRSLSNNPTSARDSLATKTLIKQASELIAKPNSYIAQATLKDSCLNLVQTSFQVLLGPKKLVRTSPRDLIRS